MLRRARTIAVVCGWLFVVGGATAHELKFVTEAFAPFSYPAADSNRAAGPLAEVVSAVCRRMRAMCSIEVHSLARANAMVENGEADGFFALTRSASNEDRFHVSEMIVASAISLLAPVSSRFIYRQAQDLDGYTIGVHGPSLEADVLDAVLKSASSGRAEVDLNNVLVLKKLASGRYGEAGKGLAAINRDVAVYLMRHEGIAGLKEVGELARVDYGVGFVRRGANAAHFKPFNQALKDMIRDGEVRRILRKYGLQAAA